MGNQTFAAEVEIAAPAERVWEILTDFPAYPVWNPFTRTMHALLVPGEAVRMKLDLGWTTAHQVATIRTVDPPGLIVWDVVVGARFLLRAERTQRVVPTAPNRCRYVTEDVMVGPLAILVRLLFGRALERGFSGMAQALRARAESSPAGRDIPDRG